MRQKADQKASTRSNILAAAGRGFRKAGYGGIGVDGLAKEAGVTSGAFYGHFPSKSEAFKEAAVEGLAQLQQAIEAMRSSEGDAWVDAFIDFYMSQKRTCNLSESCALQSLSPEVARADEATKAAYEEQLLKVADAMAEGLGSGSLAARRRKAWAILAILSGGVTMARSAADAKTGAQIGSAVKAAALGLAHAE